MCILIPHANGAAPGVTRDVRTHRAGPDTAVKARVSEAYGRLPLSFEANQGQTASQVDFVSRGSGYTVFVAPTEAVLTLSSTRQERDMRNERSNSRVGSRTQTSQSNKPETAVLRMRLVGASATAQAEGRDELPGKVNYLRGNDPTRWRTGIRTYAKVSYEDVYPGIDMVYYGNQRQLEYDFIVGPGADPDAIALRFDGADTLKVDEKGNLILQTDGGQLTQLAPRVYQEIDGVRRNLPGRYTLHAPATGVRSVSPALGPDLHVVGFDVGRYDRSRSLVIDPVLVYATYLGGTGIDNGRGIAVDSAGSAYVTGYTTSSDFPITPGASDTTFGGGSDAFVTKLEASGTALVYSTYLGGGSGDYGAGITVDSAGSAYVTGSTFSIDFPTISGAFDTTLGGGRDAFVTKLEASGAALAYSTYLGGTSVDQGNGIFVDSAGNAYMTGSTQSSDFPTTPGAFDTTLAGAVDAFVTKIEASGTGLVYSTYLGGALGDPATDVGSGIAIDSAGSAYVTGYTYSRDFPTTPGAFSTTLHGYVSVFVTKLEANGVSLAYSTYLGGSGVKFFGGDLGSAIAVDSAGSAYVTGLTYASDFPTTPGAFDRTLGGSKDAFVTKLAPSGAALAYSTYLGGGSDEYGFGIAVDSVGSAYVTGLTSSSDFPATPGAPDTTLGGPRDAFVATLEASGAALAYSTYLGGSNDGFGYAIAVDSAGSIYVTGFTTSSDFPTTAGAFDPTFAGAEDAFVVRIGEAGASEADLVETALSNPPSAVAPGNSFSVTDTTLNQGGTDAGSSTSRFYLSVDAVKSTGDRLLTGGRAVSSLPAGIGASGTVTVKVPATIPLGKYWMLACADDKRVVIESSETNNCRASAATVLVALPDLVTTSVSNPPAQMGPGGKFTATDIVQNAGTATALASMTRYYLSANTVKDGSDVLLTGTRAVPILAPSGTSPGSRIVTIPVAIAAGSYYLLACADDLLKVKEVSEANNCTESEGTVLVALPDLVTTSVSDPPAQMASGRKFVVTDIVQNVGTGTALASTTRYYLSANTVKDGSDVLLTGTRAVPILTSSGTSTGSRSVTIPIAVAAGSYYLLACADDLRKVTEVNETNNCAESARRVRIGWLDSSACDLTAGSLWQPNEGPTDYNLHLQPLGELKAVMIFVDFLDAPQSETTSSLYNLLVPNSVSWYAEASYGRMSLSVTPVHTWFAMPQNSAAYGFGDGLTFEEHRAYIADAIAVSDAVVDYSQYEIVYVVASNNSAIGYSSAFHPSLGDGVPVDGTEIRHSATFGADIRIVRPNYGSHALIHETGHLIGLPDLYELDTPLNEALRFAGGWDVMSWVAPGAHFLAWHKRKHGWLDPGQVVCMSGSGIVEEIVTPLALEGGIKAIVVPLGPSTAYVVEVRQQIGQDARLCDKGVLIYSVDATVESGSGPILVIPAQNGTDPEQIDACGPLYDAPFDLGAGEVASYTDAAAGVTVEVLATAGTGYVVRVTRD